jgi:hypothetical protein
MSEKVVQDYILLIMNCKKYREKAIKQKETWLPLLPSRLKYYHVIGNPDLETQFLFDDVDNILYVKTMDDYNSLPKKVIASYNAINETFQYKYIYKTDDDQNLTNPNFFDIIINITEKDEPKLHYGGHIVDVKIPHYSEYYKIHPELPKHLFISPIKYCNGRFYFLSKEVVIQLLTKREKIESEYLEDYAVGLHMDDKFKKNIVNIKSKLYFTEFEF